MEDDQAAFDTTALFVATAAAYAPIEDGLLQDALVPLDSSADTAVADTFVVLLLRAHEDCEEGARHFVTAMEKSVRIHGGKMQMRNDVPKHWQILDGVEHMKAPNHLSPALFDADAILVGAFSCSELLQTWWSSDEVFCLMKARAPMEKIGVFAFDGLQRAYDVRDRSRVGVAFDDKFILIEFIKMQAFKPVQHYVDSYKRLSERPGVELGISCNVLFAEGVSVILMNEFPLEAACASTWQIKADAMLWYDAEIYQKHLMPLRREYAVSSALLAPLFEERTNPIKERTPLMAALARR